MKYSVIIPTLNEEKLLPAILKQLRSVKERIYDLEIIVSDGGSTDKTILIANESADIIKIHNESCRQNIAMGRNAGAKVASGDVLIFVNGDIIFSDPVRFFNFLDSDFYKTEHAAMTCYVKVFPQDEILLDKLYHKGYNHYFKFLNNIGVGMGRGECQVIRKKVFEKVNGYNETLAAGEDFDLFRRVRKLGTILYTDKVIIYESPRRYRKYGYAGVTWSWIKNGFSVLLKNKSISTEWEQVR